MKKEVMTYKSSKSPISEQFRTLRTNIQFMNINKKMKVLHITSTFPNEGKSWISSNLAVTFAQAGKKVILIDSDMRKGRQYAIFGVSPKPGLSNILSQSEVDEEGRISENVLDYIQPTEVENLQIISAGDIPPNPSELLVSAQMIGLLEELKKISDIVIIDGTPSEIVTDSVILSRLADSTVIVTAHKITKKDALDRVIKNIQNVGGNIAGVIINKVPVSAKKYDSRYYYYGREKDFSEKKNKKVAKREKSKKEKEDKKANLAKASKKEKKINKENNTNKTEIENTIVSENNEQTANDLNQTWNNETQENVNTYQDVSNNENNLNQVENNETQGNTNNYQTYGNENQIWNNETQGNTNNYQTYSNENQIWNNETQGNVSNYQTYSNDNNVNQSWNNDLKESAANVYQAFGNENENNVSQIWNSETQENNVMTDNREQSEASKTLEQTNLILQQINDYLNKEKNG